MYTDLMTVLAVELQKQTGIDVVRGRPRWGRAELTIPAVALLCTEIPPAQGAIGRTGALTRTAWTVVILAENEPAALELVETVVRWADGKPELPLSNGKRALIARVASAERETNDEGLDALDYAFSVPIQVTA